MSDEARDSLYLQELAVQLGATQSGDDWYAMTCPQCESVDAVTLTMRGASCRNEVCPWQRTHEQLQADAEVGKPSPATQGLPLAIPVGEAADDGIPEYIVDGWLIEREIHVWAGRGGSGKSSAEHETAGAVAAGFPVFDRFATRRTAPALIVSEEDSAGLIRNHLEALCEGHGWPPKVVLERVHVLCFAQVKIDQAHWQKHLIQETQRVGAGVVFLDPLFELTSGEENSNTEAKAYVSFLRRLAAETGAAVVVIHHGSKPSDGKGKRDRIRGASALYDAARVVFWLDEDMRGIAVETLKFSRGEAPPRFVVGRTVETDPENPLAWRSARLTYLTSEVAQEWGGEALVLKALAETPGLKSTELKECAKGTPGVSAVDLSTAIKSLENRGVITFDPGPGNAKFWRLCEPAEDPQQARQASLPNLPEPAGQAGDALPEPASPLGEQAGSEGRPPTDIDSVLEGST